MRNSKLSFVQSFRAAGLLLATVAALLSVGLPAHAQTWTNNLNVATTPWSGTTNWVGGTPAAGGGPEAGRDRPARA